MAVMVLLSKGPKCGVLRRRHAWRDLCQGSQDNRKLRLTAIPRLPTIGLGGPFISHIQVA